MLEPLEPRTLLSSVPGSGLRATYFNNANFTGTTVTRTDAHVSFNWGKRSPDPRIAPDTFVARWTGQIQPKFSETYTFRMLSDDGVRLWINHRLLIDTWDGQTGPAAIGKRIALARGRRYDVQLEYREKTGTAACRLLWSSPSTPQSTIPTACLFPAPQPLRSAVDHAVAFARTQLRRTLAQLGGGQTDRFPSITSSATGTWTTVGASDWTAGFFAGTLWQMHARTADRSLRLAAEAFTRSLESARTAHDDTGFRFIPSYLPLYLTHGRPEDRQVLIDAAAAKVAAFDSTIGMFQSIDHKAPDSTDPRANFPVLMDHTMDLELVYEAAKLAGRSHWIDLANQHLVHLSQSMVRPDGSTVQWGYFDRATGDLISAETRQGMSGDSSWSRGQAWGMYSFITAYGETGRSDFLATAKKLCDYWIGHLPSGSYVPYWDFDAPAGSDTPVDSSAAAVASSALFKFAALLPADDPDRALYLNAARGTLAELCSPAFLAEGSPSRGLLLHGAKSIPANVTDNSLIYGDYYFLQAVNRFAGLR